MATRLTSTNHSCSFCSIPLAERDDVGPMRLLLLTGNRNQTSRSRHTIHVPEMAQRSVPRRRTVSETLREHITYPGCLSFDITRLGRTWAFRVGQTLSNYRFGSWCLATVGRWLATITGERAVSWIAYREITTKYDRATFTHPVGEARVVFPTVLCLIAPTSLTIWPVALGIRVWAPTMDREARMHLSHMHLSHHVSVSTSVSPRVHAVRSNCGVGIWI